MSWITIIYDAFLVNRKCKITNTAIVCKIINKCSIPMRSTYNKLTLLTLIHSQFYTHWTADDDNDSNIVNTQFINNTNQSINFTLAYNNNNRFWHAKPCNLRDFWLIWSIFNCVSPKSASKFSWFLTILFCCQLSVDDWFTSLHFFNSNSLEFSTIVCVCVLSVSYSCTENEENQMHRLDVAAQPAVNLIRFVIY